MFTTESTDATIVMHSTAGCVEDTPIGEDEAVIDLPMPVQCHLTLSEIGRSSIQGACAQEERARTW